MLRLKSFKQLIKPSIFGVLLIVASIGIGIIGSRPVAAQAPTTVAAAASKCGSSFFGLRPWYHYMPEEEFGVKRGDQPTDSCGIRCFNIFQQKQANVCGQTNSDVPGVILAIIDNLLRISGLVAVAFILKGSFEYVGSRGNAEKTAAAQSTIIAALTGLAIALVAVGLVAFIGNRLG